MLEQDSLHRSLFACCLQIVLFAYDVEPQLSQNPRPTDFPFVLKVCDVSPYLFYRCVLCAYICIFLKELVIEDFVGVFVRLCVCLSLSLSLSLSVCVCMFCEWDESD